jgi:transcriptional regulator with XRE-family HTH domain
MDFQELQRRFIEHLRDRIRSGELTERRLARMTGISQPHVHNVLAGKRIFSPELADTILHVLRIDLLDLLRPDEESDKPRRQ